MSQKPSIPKGTRDFPPAVMLRREFILNTIRSVYKKFGYEPIETPSMEKLSVLTGKYGEEGDRLIFKILNSGDFLAGAHHTDDYKKLTPEISGKALRYDLTVPFARFVVMNQNEISFPFKRYQIQPVWRGDRPQKGRYREFYQCDADVVGSDSLIYEAEFISIYDEALSALGLKDFSIRISNRKILNGYAEAVGQSEKFQDICTAIDKLDKVGESGVKKELLEREVPEAAADQLLQMITFAGTNEEKIAYLDKLFENSESGKQGIAEMREVFDFYQYMDRFKGTVDFDLTLARGLTYYTGTIYEVVTNEVKMGSICGGGRYDNLTGVFGKPGLSGVGISFGVDRIYDVMLELDLFDESATQGTEVMLINFGGESLKTCLQVLSRLRKAGIAAEIYPDSAKLKKQFSYADRKNVTFTLAIGDNEVATGKYQLKNMKTGDQEGLSLEEILGKFERL
jgi:histidyl-tRNA synthetase